MNTLLDMACTNRIPGPQYPYRYCEEVDEKCVTGIAIRDCPWSGFIVSFVLWRLAYHIRFSCASLVLAG